MDVLSIKAIKQEDNGRNCVAAKSFSKVMVAQAGETTSTPSGSEGQSLLHTRTPSPAGTAKVTLGDTEIYVHENESAYVPKSTLHRLENNGKIPLEIIEVQNGEYLEEDDIERFSDIYSRT